jgi:hypothetical protein
MFFSPHQSFVLGIKGELGIFLTSYRLDFQKTITMNEDSVTELHKLYIKNDTIYLKHNTITLVEIPIAEIKMIGEYTNDKGPFQDDWYVSFYYGENEYFEFSMNTNEIMDMLSNLGKRLNSEIIPSLFSSTDWKSQILFPQKYKGNPIWEIKELESKSPFEKLKAFFRFKNDQLIMTNQAIEIFKNN